MHDKIHVIYIPGLGDSKAGAQRLVVKTWKLWGVEPELLQMRWADEEPWSEKLQRLLERIDTLTSAGEQVALVGASAGGSAVINAYAARPDKIVGCVLISGKINRPDAIGGSYRSKHPSFVESAEACEYSLTLLDTSQRRRILSLHALFDPVVPSSDSYIESAQNRSVMMAGHSTTIATQLLFGAGSFLYFIQKLDHSTELAA